MKDVAVTSLCLPGMQTKALSKHPHRNIQAGRGGSFLRSGTPQLRQGVCEFHVSLGYIIRLCLQNRRKQEEQNRVEQNHQTNKMVRLISSCNHSSRQAETGDDIGYIQGWRPVWAQSKNKTDMNRNCRNLLPQQNKRYKPTETLSIHWASPMAQPMSALGGRGLTHGRHEAEVVQACGQQLSDMQ